MCLWLPAIIRHHCCLLCYYIKKKMSHEIIYFVLNARLLWTDLIELFPSHVLILMFVWYLSNRISVSCRRAAPPPPLTAAAAGEFVTFSLLTKRWTEDLHFSTSHISSSHSSLSRRQLLPHTWPGKCVCTCPRMHDCVWVLLGWSKR